MSRAAELQARRMGGEIAKLRRELAEIAGAFRQSEQYREEAHSQLAVIVDEAFGPQEVLPLPNLLARLEHLLTERARQHEEVRREFERLRSELAEMTGCATHWCAEGGRSEREHRETLIRCRAAAQILIAEIGASGPESVEETARRAVERIQELKGVAEDLCSSCDPSIHIEQLTEALRNLVVSVDRSGSRDTAVLCDLDAARAVLGGRS